ncbi:uncharacterized protein METZ01_LOCUS329980 [marine metagenome]|uniref:Uncharacterized protein n=1 Tax=marine metagenome TaxID=408172 RepID=A0A382PV64_9ZZZZ
MKIQQNKQLNISDDFDNESLFH